MGHSEQVYIHIGGVKRSGKSTLARHILKALHDANKKPILLEVDEIKNNIFGKEFVASKLPDTPESLDLHRFGLKAIFEVCVPTVLSLGGSPIVVDTHDSIMTYESGKKLAVRHGVPFTFLFVEAPTLEEAKRRAARASSEDHSDMKDFTNPAIVESFLLNVRTLDKVYKDFTEPRHIIEQDDPEVMAQKVLSFIFS